MQNNSQFQINTAAQELNHLHGIDLAATNAIQQLLAQPNFMPYNSTEVLVLQEAPALWQVALSATGRRLDLGHGWVAYLAGREPVAVLMHMGGLHASPPALVWADYTITDVTG